MCIPHHNALHRMHCVQTPSFPPLLPPPSSPPPPCPLSKQQAISRWQAKLESVEGDVQRVMAEEREETALRKAEMEANKAQV